MNEPTLRFPETQEDIIFTWISGVVAQTPDGEVYLRRSKGHRRSGRPTRYTVHYSDYQDWEHKGFFHFTARSDEEALEKANARLAKIEAAETYEAMTTERIPW